MITAFRSRHFVQSHLYTVIDQCQICSKISTQFHRWQKFNWHGIEKWFIFKLVHDFNSYKLIVYGKANCERHNLHNVTYPLKLIIVISLKRLHTKLYLILWLHYHAI